MKIKITTSGNFSKTKRSLWKKANLIDTINFEKYAKIGLNLLKASTPVDTGETANSWYYTIEKDQNRVIIRWCNRNVVDGANVAVLLQFGHASKAGDWVEGINYINPAILPVFEQLVKDVKEEMRNVKRSG